MRYILLTIAVLLLLCFTFVSIDAQPHATLATQQWVKDYLDTYRYIKMDSVFYGRGLRKTYVPYLIEKKLRSLRMDFDTTDALTIMADWDFSAHPLSYDEVDSNAWNAKEDTIYLTPNCAVQTSGSGHLMASDVTDTELSYLDGVGLPVQDQLDLLGVVDTVYAGTGIIVSPQKAKTCTVSVDSVWVRGEIQDTADVVRGELADTLANFLYLSSDDLKQNGVDVTLKAEDVPACQTQRPIYTSTSAASSDFTTPASQPEWSITGDTDWHTVVIVPFEKTNYNGLTEKYAKICCELKTSGFGKAAQAQIIVDDGTGGHSVTSSTISNLFTTYAIKSTWVDISSLDIMTKMCNVTVQLKVADATKTAYMRSICIDIMGSDS